MMGEPVSDNETETARCVCGHGREQHHHHNGVWDADAVFCHSCDCLQYRPAEPAPDEDGRCTVCGLVFEDPAELKHECPPGFLGSIAQPVVQPAERELMVGQARDFLFERRVDDLGHATLMADFAAAKEAEAAELRREREAFLKAWDETGTLDPTGCDPARETIQSQ